MLKLNKTNFILFLCLVVVPVFTILLGIQVDILRYNFTFMSTYSKTSTFFYAWAMLTIWTTILTLKEIRDVFNLPKPTNYHIFTMFTLFTSTTFIPYTNHTSLISLLHVLLAYISIIFLNYLLFTIYNFLKIIKYPYTHKLAAIYVFILNLCFIISIVFGSISTLVEIIYVVSIAFILGFIIIKKS